MAKMVIIWIDILAIHLLYPINMLLFDMYLKYCGNRNNWAAIEFIFLKRASGTKQNRDRKACEKVLINDKVCIYRGYMLKYEIFDTWDGSWH